MPSVWPPPVNLSSQTRWMNTKDWFHTRKKYTDLLVLVLVLAVVLLLVLGVPYALDHRPGDVSQAQEVILNAAQYPNDTQVQQGMALIQDTFQKELHNCTLHTLTYDGAYSSQFTQELWTLYPDAGMEQGAFVITASLTTGSNPPQGLESHTTYDDYQWILGDAGGTLSLLDRGRFLVDRR